MPGAGHVLCCTALVTQGVAVLAAAAPAKKHTLCCCCCCCFKELCHALTDAAAGFMGLQCHNLTVRAKGKVLLENTTFTVAVGRRYGLIGPNG